MYENISRCSLASLDLRFQNWKEYGFVTYRKFNDVEITSHSRRWSELIDSDEFYKLRRQRGLLRFSVFVVSFNDYGLLGGSYEVGHDSYWRMTSLMGNATGYDDGTTMLRCDAWTGLVINRAKMSVLRKKFAAAVVNGKVYVAGGSTRTSAVEEYDPKEFMALVYHAPRNAIRVYRCGDGWCFVYGWFGGVVLSLKSPPLPTQVRLDGTVRFSCVGMGKKVVLIQVMGCIDDLLRRSGRSSRGVKDALVLVYDSDDGKWSRGADLPDVVRRAACVCVEW
ncbi:F-box/kelch-repeat protein [Tanacetum coccineum]